MLTVPDSIKDLLHLDSCKKNIRIHFPNGEREDICNDLIVKDSVSFTESLCSQDDLKFGLCESPVFECEVVGVSNITGATIEVSCEVFCDSSVSGAEWKLDLEAYVYSIPYGTFIVSECKRQADMIHRKVVAYGGTAAFNWELALTESKKPCTTTYTPNIGYFLGANGIDVISDVTDESTVAWTYDSMSHTIELKSDLHYPYGIRIYATIRSRNAIFGAGYYKNITDYDALYKVFNVNRLVNPTDLKAQIYAFCEDYPYINTRYYQNFEKAMYGGIFTYYDGDQSSRTVYGIKDYCIYPYSNNWYSQTDSELSVLIPFKVELHIRRTTYPQGDIKATEIQVFTEDMELHKFKYKNDAPSWSSMSLSISRIDTFNLDWSDFDLEEVTNAFIETFGDFLAFNRNGLNNVSLINIKQQFNLLPDDDLYPNTSLYPQGVTGGKLLPNDYQSCWYDDYYTLPFGAIVCKYKNTNNNDAQYTLYLTEFNDSTSVELYRVYDLSDNYLIKQKTWTQAQIQAICETIAANIEGVTYMPVEFVGRGLPYVEAGDTFEILTASNDSITTIVLNRTLSGEQVLTDSYKSV